MKLNELNALLNMNREGTSRIPYHSLICCTPYGSRIHMEVFNPNNQISLLETRCGYFVEIVGYGLPDYLKAIKYEDSQRDSRLIFIDSIVSLKVESLPNVTNR